MKRTPTTKPRANNLHAMLPEYHFDYRKARPNRFIQRIDQSRRVIILDSDVSKIFENSESVNSVLRALIASMPKSMVAKTPRKSLRE